MSMNEKWNRRNFLLSAGAVGCAFALAVSADEGPSEVRKVRLAEALVACQVREAL